MIPGSCNIKSDYKNVKLVGKEPLRHSEHVDASPTDVDASSGSPYDDIEIFEEVGLNEPVEVDHPNST